MEGRGNWLRQEKSGFWLDREGVRVRGARRVVVVWPEQGWGVYRAGGDMHAWRDPGLNPLE